jgi:hypothetical protein
VIEILGAAGLLAFLVASLAVGVRLLRLGWHTRQIPELTIGAGLVIGVAGAYVPETIALATDLMSEATEKPVLGVTQVATRLTALSILFFTWRVFRPQERWAAGLVGLLTLLLLVSYFGFPFSRIYVVTVSDRIWFDVYTVSRTACLAWGAVESLVYHRGARRRLLLGLADPVVTNRFLLWGTGLAATSALMGTHLWARALGVDPGSAGWVLLESMLGLVGAVAMSLAFFPPAAYRRLLTARAAAASAEKGPQ